jgi:hypothetical protein
LRSNTFGYNWEYLSEFPSDLDTLLTYDGIFISGDFIDNYLLIQYVNSGGNVYLAGGSGDIASNEANQWNTFLGFFGLAFAPVSSSDPDEYNNIYGTIDIDSTHSVFEGVLNLYQEYGSDIVDMDPMDDRGEVLVSYQGSGLYAIFDGSQAGSDNNGSIDQEDNQVDSDSDGIFDLNDACQTTSPGEIVDIDGCSINDLCPCEGQWKNHGSYVKCAAQESKSFVSEGLMSKAQKVVFVSITARSRCGHKKIR